MKYINPVGRPRCLKHRRLGFLTNRTIQIPHNWWINKLKSWSIFAWKQHKEIRKPKQEPSLSLHELPPSMNSLMLFEQLSQAWSGLWALRSDSNINTIFSHEGIRNEGNQSRDRPRWIVQSVLCLQFYLANRGDAWSIYLGSRAANPNMNFLGDVFNLSMAFSYPAQNIWIHIHTCNPQVGKCGSV